MIRNGLPKSMGIAFISILLGGFLCPLLADPGQRTFYEPLRALELNRLASMAEDSAMQAWHERRYTDAEFYFQKYITFSEMEAANDSRLQDFVAHAFSSRGLFYFDAGQFRPALEDFTQAIEIDPRRGGYYFYRARVFRKLGHSDSCARDMETCVRLDSSQLTSRAGFYESLGDDTMALLDYNEAIRQSPDNASAHRERGFIYQRQRKYYLAAEDHKFFLTSEGWSPQYLSGDVAISAFFEYMYADSLTNATEILEDALRYYDPQIWPRPVFEYLAGIINERTLLSIARNSEERAQAHAYIGLHLSFQPARRSEAVFYLTQWKLLREEMHRAGRRRQPGDWFSIWADVVVEPIALDRLRFLSARPSRRNNRALPFRPH